MRIFSPQRRPAALLLLLAAAALAVSAGLGTYLREARQARMPPAATSAAAHGMEKPPALLTFATTALGGFRGILADALWLRAGRMQEQRRFVELVQLSDWITALEPHNEEVWVFHAWNLAYNVTVLMTRPEDRWHWVYNGIRLLRDRGIPLNPESATLKRELGWIFQHKIGTDSDASSAYFRTRWAQEMAPCLLPDGAAPEPGSALAKRLAETARMDAAVMRRLEQQFGTIDWRLPLASSLYWSALALENDPPGHERLPCRRMVYTSLIDLCFRGTLLGNPATPGWTFQTGPRPRHIPATQAYLEDSLRRFDFSGIRYAYTGFLCDAILYYLLSGQPEKARTYHQTLTDFFASLGAPAGTIAPLERFLDTSPDTYGEALNRLGYQ